MRNKIEYSRRKVEIVHQEGRNDQLCHRQTNNSGKMKTLNEQHGVLGESHWGGLKKSGNLVGLKYFLPNVPHTVKSY